MFRLLTRVARLTLSPLRAAARRPRTTAAVVALVPLAATAAAAGYARHQWYAAREAVAAERPGEAQDRLRFCMRVWPRSPEVHLLAARAARLGGDLPGAEAHLNRCLKLAGGATEAVQLEFLLCRAQAGQVDDVVGPLVEAVERGHPDGPVILETLAKAYILSLRYKAAYGCLSRWVELRPDAAKAYALRGWTLERLNNYKAAMQDYRRAVEIDPDQFAARLRIAEMLMEDKQVPEALPHLERLARRDPDRPEVQARLGMCRFLQGEAVEARRLMESAVRHLPNDPVLLIHLARLDLQEGRYPEADARLRRVLATDPTDNEAWYTLASVLRLGGRPDEAAQALKDYETNKARVDRVNKLLQDVADSPSARADDYAEIGAMMLLINKERLGLYWLDRALERDPANPASHRALAEYFEKKGQAAKAAAHRRHLAAAAPRP